MLAAPAPPSDAARSALEPSRIGRYVTLGRIGEGGMGVVYVAYDTDLDRKVAVKLVRAVQLGPDQARKRVLREAQAMAQVSHPNVVHVYEVGEHQPLESSDASSDANSDADSDGSEAQIYIAMEFIAGSNLHHYQTKEGRTTAQ